MEIFLFVIIIIGISMFIGIISWIIRTISNSKKYLELKPKLNNLEYLIKKHELKIEKDRVDSELMMKLWREKLQKDKEELQKDKEKTQKEIQKNKEETKEEIQKIASQKSMGFPWLAEAFADYFTLKDGQIENHLKYKKHPAYTAAENVKIIKNEKRELIRENKILDYKIKYFEKLFPWLSELIAEDENEEMPVRIDYDNTNDDDEDEDRVKDYLTPEEYRSLPSVERNQIALDRYLRNRNKSKWAIGRDYEMYVGYLYGQKGYHIEYKGIIDGFDDLGRDIIATKKDEICIIQCKYWAQYKEIHEKHIFQLFGTTMEYWIKTSVGNNKPKTFEEFAEFLNEDKLKPIFFTSTNISDKAKEMANALSVEIVENHPLAEFPRIKCNINHDEFGLRTKIYHLPVDQQYDRAIVGNRAGEFYAFTVKEAEDAGFRRAFKHRFQL